MEALSAWIGAPARLISDHPLFALCSGLSSILSLLFGVSVWRAMRSQDDLVDRIADVLACLCKHHRNPAAEYGLTIVRTTSTGTVTLREETIIVLTQLSDILSRLLKLKLDLGDHPYLVLGLHFQRLGRAATASRLLEKALANHDGGLPLGRQERGICRRAIEECQLALWRFEPLRRSPRWAAKRRPRPRTLADREPVLTLRLVVENTVTSLRYCLRTGWALVVGRRSLSPVAFRL
ncbi:MAG TPA: hypothetical protein VF017_18440 [Thermoanaerobaculia bacterium]|nr:hypothetical protein [Thermoanaerobaculia bacterium]